MILRTTTVFIALFSVAFCIADQEVAPSSLEIKQAPSEEKPNTKTWKTSSRPDDKSITTGQNLDIELSNSFRMKTTTSPIGRRKTRILRQPFSVSENRSSGTISLAMEILYREMAQQCPHGWQKIHEWVDKPKDNFYLNYEISCPSTATGKY